MLGGWTPAPSPLSPRTISGDETCESRLAIEARQEGGRGQPRRVT
jgi:hypothetical protein